MDDDLIERLAREAGLKPERRCLGHGDYGDALPVSGEFLRRFAALVAEECARECTLMRQPPQVPDRCGRCTEGHTAGFSKSQLFEYAYLDREASAAAIRTKFKEPSNG